MDGKDPSTTVRTDCSDCIKHVYSFQRTPTADSVTLSSGLGQRIVTVYAPSIQQHNGCPEDFIVKATSPTGKVMFDVSSVQGDTLIAAPQSSSTCCNYGDTLDQDLKSLACIA